MLVFDHITKTAGTTFNESYISAAFDPTERLIVTGAGDAHDRDLRRLLRMPSATRQKLRVVGGHLIENFRLVEDPGTRHVTIVRDPIKRMISHYRHFLDVPDSERVARAKFGDNLTFAEFAEHVVPQNIQAATILGPNYAALESDGAIRDRLNERFFLVGLTENFLAFVFYLYLTANVPLCLFNNANVRVGSEFTPTEADLELVKTRDAYDLRLYDIVRNEFNTRWAQVISHDRQLLFERFADQLRIYRERTSNDPTQSVALREDPLSWAAADDYEAVFLRSPPPWGETTVLKRIDAASGFIPEGCEFSADNRLSTRLARASLALSVPCESGGSTASAPIALQVVLQVLEGLIGVFVAERETRHPLTREVNIQQTSRPIEIRIALPNEDSVAYILIRNQSSMGRSRVRVLSLAIVADNAARINGGQTHSEVDSEQDDNRVPLWDFVACGDAMLMVQSGGLGIITDKMQWSYAAQCNYPIPATEQKDTTVLIRLRVDEGDLGVGWLNAEGNDWVCRASAKPSSELQELELAIPAGTVGGSLIVENWSDKGTSRAFIKEVRVVERCE